MSNSFLTLVELIFRMERIRSTRMRLFLFALYISILATTDARTLMQMSKLRGQEFHTSPEIDAINHLKVSNHLNIINSPMSMTSNDELDGITYPFSFPPFQSLGPLSSQQNTPPFCVFPPIFTPQPPSSYGQPSPTPPPFHFTPSIPNQSPPPPITSGSSPPSPPHHGPSPPSIVPGPPKHGPSPPAHLPPVVYPPPSGPKGPGSAVWCVAKPTVPEPIIQAALDYACGSGADCKSIQPNGPCFKPNTVIAHASYAFNSYWQKTKVAGGTCDFGGSAMIITVDPSFDGCKFIYF